MDIDTSKIINALKTNHLYALTLRLKEALDYYLSKLKDNNLSVVNRITSEVAIEIINDKLQKIDNLILKNYIQIACESSFWMKELRSAIKGTLLKADGTLMDRKPYLPIQSSKADNQILIENWLIKKLVIRKDLITLFLERKEIKTKISLTKKDNIYILLA